MYVIYHPGRLSPKDQLQLKADWKATLGEGAPTPIIMCDGMRLDVLSVALNKASVHSADSE